MPILELTYNGYSGSANWFSFYYETSDGTTSDIQDLCQNARDQLNGEVGAVLNNSFAMSRMTVMWWPSLTSPALPKFTVAVTPMSGLDVSTPLASRQTVLVEFKTNLAKPAPQKKRCFVGRYGELGNDNGFPTGDVTDALTAWAEQMLIPVLRNGHTFTPVAIRKVIDADHHVVVTESEPIASYLPPTKWAFVRTRDAGRGI